MIPAGSRALRADVDGVPVDPWGQPYAYTVLDDGRGAYDLRSAGDDEVLGTEDDVVGRTP